MVKSKLNLKETQYAIDKLKSIFSASLASSLNLVRVSAPLFLEKSSGLNDSLSGEKPVSFKTKTVEDDIEIVHSLAKWKRYALQKYNFSVYEGIYTDMNAIRKEEDLDKYHSLYVDQWDWELIIEKKDRNIDFLKSIVRKIYSALLLTESTINEIYPILKPKLSPDVYFITARDLEAKYPDLSISEREKAITKEKGSTFIIGIGYPLSNNLPHSNRAKDYDDWTLNGDLVVYDEINDSAMELSSMGIRVDRDAILKQYSLTASEVSKISEYHKLVVQETYPFTIGGGIGQSRIAMFLLEKRHIGEVQVSVWDKNNKNFANSEKISIL
ncbi:aspartate--ammonia ligase [Metamycoplasma hyosynoviae]|uniref:aspartate--ammonia ligase n=1 Tax=Metamycoplasma hyosynoviae TaxID=29559 RepID=UPI0004616EED|nr:aspartate--ammonia ligase [Metamycoplasma hyosynoviae]KDE41911.1 aspartate--ammonia ligase [Metamycoplasma hyosynoviae]KDE42567.1 aspartate--ammonia ligase [Metamycoplasma hyosynoviae]KDE43795.1 aspartate--ammonia ligase [Metamycoplasma hyosynoviae]KDE44368.1 aspartate--ammonia ligase [Metamycoplasma hyosynoviae]KDE45556.1 aspartate--ammonia ligase [Metamycoplasma hyosynoviae]